MNVNYMDAPELRQVVQELRRYPAEVKRLQIIAANRDLTIRRLLLEVEILRSRGSVFKVAGKAYVDDKLVTEAELTAMMIDMEV